MLLYRIRGFRPGPSAVACLRRRRVVDARAECCPLYEMVPGVGAHVAQGLHPGRPGTAFYRSDRDLSPLGHAQKQTQGQGMGTGSRASTPERVRGGRIWRCSETRDWQREGRSDNARVSVRG